MADVSNKVLRGHLDVLQQMFTFLVTCANRWLLCVVTPCDSHLCKLRVGYVALIWSLRALPAGPAMRAAATAGWRRRWWGFLNCAQQRAVASAFLGGTWRAPAQPGSDG
eukprot:s4904_g2.t1